MNLLFAIGDFEVFLFLTGFIGIGGLIYFSYEKKTDDAEEGQLTLDQVRELQQHLREDAKRKVDLVKSSGDIKKPVDLQKEPKARQKTT
jgi:hypothetical protein